MQLNDQTEDPIKTTRRGRLGAVEPVPVREHQYQALIDMSSDGIFLFDADQTIRLMSRSGARVFGRNADEMENLSAEDLLHPDDVARVTEAL
jgi:PAS domain S-box-containing protein